MATVVDLSKGNSYKLLVLMTTLFMCCMSGAPHVFDDKRCTHDKLICMVHVWCACEEHIRVVHHMWLTVN